MSHESSIRETRVLLSGLGMGESPRWHDGRLWFSNWGTNEIVALDLDGFRSGSMNAIVPLQIQLEK